MPVSASIEQEKKKLTYTKVIVNVPTPLVKRFDKVCSIEGFTRQEAIKQALREFVHRYSQRNENDPELVKEAMKSLYIGMAEGARETAQTLQNVPAQQKALPDNG